jgi:hypothetical protein
VADRPRRRHHQGRLPRADGPRSHASRSLTPPCSWSMTASRRPSSRHGTSPCPQPGPQAADPTAARYAPAPVVARPPGRTPRAVRQRTNLPAPLDRLPLTLAPRSGRRRVTGLHISSLVARAVDDIGRIAMRSGVEVVQAVCKLCPRSHRQFAVYPGQVGFYGLDRHEEFRSGLLI